MDSHYIISTLIAAAGAIVTWWVSNIWEMVQRQQQQLSALSLKIAESYVTKAEYDKTIDKLFDKLDDIQKDIRAQNKEKV